MTRLISSLCIITLAFVPVSVSAPADTPQAQAPDTGTIPTGANGRPLNLGFETGTLADWVADGDAFKGQPIKGDTVHPRRGDMTSAHEGKFWIGTYEVSEDGPQGTLTSVPFTVSKPFASFLVAGGSYARHVRGIGA